MSNFSFSIVLSNKPNTEGSLNCSVWQALFGVFVALFVVCGTLLLRQHSKAGHHSTTQNGVSSSELVNVHNSKVDYAQSNDSSEEEYEVETEGIGGVDGDGEHLPSEL